MSDATAQGWSADWVEGPPEPQARTAPPRPTPGPVFIGDCVTQWGGRPMLLLLAEAWARRDE